MNLLERTCKVTRIIAEYLVSAQLIAIVVIVLLGVFFRTVLNSPIVWSDEVSKYLNFWIAFLGAGLVVHKNLHMRIDFIYSLTPKNWQFWIDVMVNGLCVLCSSLLIISSSSFVSKILGLKTPVSNLPQALFFSSIFFGGCFLLIEYLLQLLLLISHKGTLGGDENESH